MVGFNQQEAVCQDCVGRQPSLPEADSESPLQASVHHSVVVGTLAIRKGNWKETAGQGPGSNPWGGLAQGGSSCAAVDMKTDRHDDENTFAEYPEVVGQLETLLQEFKARELAAH